MNQVEHKEIQEVNLKVDGLVKAFVDQRGEIKEIRDALLGNDFSDKVGLVKQVLDLRARVEKLERYWNNAKWFLVGLAFLGGAGIGKLMSTLSNIVK